jgi:hypothetical protein
VIINNDIASMYPVTFTWIDWKRRPRSLELRVREELAPQKYTVYYSGGDWWEDKDAMTEWCSMQFGHRNDGYNNPRWSQGAFEFRFKNQKDAMFFMLKWG